VKEKEISNYFSEQVKKTKINFGLFCIHLLYKRILLPLFMASQQSYTITLNNNISEKEALQYLIDSEKNFIHPDKESRKIIMELLNIDKRYYKSFDLILIL
jgi:hypothetical protein